MRSVTSLAEGGGGEGRGGGKTTYLLEVVVRDTLVVLFQGLNVRSFDLIQTEHF